MSAVPFYAVDTSKRSFECSRYNKSNSLAVPQTGEFVYRCSYVSSLL